MQCMSLFSVDYTHTHLSSCCEIGDCDIKVVQKQQADPVDIIFLVCLQPEQYPTPWCETARANPGDFTAIQHGTEYSE